jgi:FKBP-type peptidyl-prolyl cis-trans isomerase
LALVGCDKMDTGSKRELTTSKDKVSYGIGLDIGRSFAQQNLAATDVDLNKLQMGIQDAVNGTKPMLSDSQLTETMMAFQKDMMSRRDSVNTKKSAENKKAGEEFLAKNAKESGVKTTSSGLQYQVIKEGTGKKPDSTSTVTVHYKGTLLDGTTFDSSVDRGQPATFPVNGVIPGWTEALKLMAAGSKWKLFVPSSLAYGEIGAGQKIGPFATLVFEVELLSVASADAAAGAHSANDGHAHK